MNPQNALIETADLAANRIPNALRSLDRWYQEKRSNLLERDCDLRVQIARQFDESKRSALRREQQQTEEELKSLNDSMQCSSLLRAARQSGECSSAIAEQRLAPTVTPARPPSVSAPCDTPAARAKLNGVAAVYNAWTEVGPYFREKIEVGAFSEVVKNCDCRLLFNHDPNLIFARTKARTLRVYDSSTVGLIFWGDLPDEDPASSALVNRIQRRDISGCSFCFSVGEDRWSLAKKIGDLDERVILRIDELFDVGPVVFPAYPQTSVQVVYERHQKNVADMSDEEYENWEYEEFCREQERKRRPVSPEQMRQMRRGYRKAGRMLNRNRELINE